MIWLINQKLARVMKMAFKKPKSKLVTEPVKTALKDQKLFCKKMVKINI